MFTRGITFFGPVLILTLAGCAGVRPYRGIIDIERVVSQRTQNQIRWNLEQNKNTEAQPDLESMLHRKLTI